MKRLFTLLLISFAVLSCEMGDDKLDDFIGRDDSSVTTIPNNQIWYTSTDGEIVEPYSGVENNYAGALTTFGVNIVSNTYVDGKGVIEFDGDVTIIGDCAFYHCYSLTSVTIPDSVTMIGGSAFYNCFNLTSVTIPDSVTTIGDCAFYYCRSFESVVTIPDSVTTIGYAAFNHCYDLTSVTIPDSVTTIGWNAFADCISLTSVTIGDSITEIGAGVFEYCSSLTSVTIPDSVITIGYRAFAYCDSLASVTIPDSVTEIKDDVFCSCSSLTSVYCKATTPPAGSWSMFSGNASGRKIYVPMESVEAYKSAEWWSGYASAIVGYDF